MRFLRITILVLVAILAWVWAWSVMRPDPPADMQGRWTPLTPKLPHAAGIPAGRSLVIDKQTISWDGDGSAVRRPYRRERRDDITVIIVDIDGDGVDDELPLSWPGDGTFGVGQITWTAWWRRDDG